MVSERWQFAIDVGGTFSDCVAIAPDGTTRTDKLLSSSVVRGLIGESSTTSRLVDSRRGDETSSFYVGFDVAIVAADGTPLEVRRATEFDPRSGAIALDAPFASLVDARSYELRSPEPAPVHLIRRVLGLRLDERIPSLELRLGTTRGTNALLERRGASTALVTTQGFRDVIAIGYQDRPDLFALDIEKPRPLYDHVAQVRERIAADGAVLEPVDRASLRAELETLRAKSVESLAVVLLHSYRRDDHEREVERIARQVGFRDVFLSSRSSRSVRIVSRGDTTLVDAYLTPVLDRYVEQIHSCLPGSDVRLMTSAGGLVAPASFRGRDSVLSGPAGGVVGVARTSERHGNRRTIGFDMGGTSTDVSRYDGSVGIEHETRKAGVRIVAPVLAIETVAAGGGSICRFDGARLLVGPESAGASPGPAAYGSRRAPHDHRRQRVARPRTSERPAVSSRRRRRAATTRGRPSNRCRPRVSSGLSTTSRRGFCVSRTRTWPRRFAASPSLEDSTCASTRSSRSVALERSTLARSRENST